MKGGGWRFPRTTGVTSRGGWGKKQYEKISQKLGIVKYKRAINGV